MGVIDVGGFPAKFGRWNTARTILGNWNAANDTGYINYVEIQLDLYSATASKIGTFSGSGTSWDDRDYENTGAITQGSKQTLSGLDITISSGDIMGFYSADGSIAYGNQTGGYLLDVSGDKFGSGSATYSSNTNVTVLLYATGISPVAPTVSTQEESDVTYNSMTGNGTVTADGDSDLTERGICYKIGTSGDPTTADSTVHDHTNAEGAFTQSLVSLAEGTSYRLRAYAINAIGTGYGATVQARTLWQARAASVIIGVVSSASRLTASIRNAATLIGNLVSAVYGQSATISSSVIIGVVVNAVMRTSSSVYVGVATTASRIVAYTRSATLSIGEIVSATKIYGSVKTASVIIGILATASRIIGYIRSSSNL
ncbi:MAG: hypothetical protein WC372_10025, partial [Candidatus Neomarinimicrobiota bacterium]